MTKAEKIFRATRLECARHIENWGFETNPNGKAVGFTRLNTDKPVCIRTCNAIQKLIDRRSAEISRCYKIGVYSSEEAQGQRETLSMVQSTLDNQRANVEAFNTELRGI